jgi:predicted dehydrogenase
MGAPKPVAVTGNTFLKTALPHMQKNAYPAEVDDLSAFHIKFENGAALQGTVCWDSHMSPDHSAQIFGTEGGASLFPAKFYRGGDILETIDLSIPVNGLPTPTAYEHMIDCIRHPEKPMIAAGSEMVTIIQILNAIQQSAQGGYEMRLD